MQNIRIFRVLALAILILLPQALHAQVNGLNVGDELPYFKARADNGKIWKSRQVVGKKNLVVYFYPAAMTGGCTKQACAYRDAREDLSAVDAEVIGISGDRVENLELFKRANMLNFTLLSDPDGQLAAMFGVPTTAGEKSIEREVDGKLYSLKRELTSARWTFIINKEGRVIYKSTEVDAAEDSKAVLEVLSKQKS